ncbi:hypothetical protein OSB04_028599 [Centaurea solstitialis]|uniref:Uncharacterized protein n=1 Tax=Centaurea solstitialis TaxID=347529 RepID=A0AA38T0V7_9ASTR|nr:hypothetical protein OSB04_028599 [Centaurea solstitialis]
MSGGTSTPSTSITPITATTHFPIKVTASNFPVWRKQIQSTLIGLDLDKFINGSLAPPAQSIDTKTGKKNPAFLSWYRQDQLILGAILSSCTDTIQPIVSSANTAREAWERLTSSYASASHSRIISLKTKLTKNPKGNRSVTEFLHDMQSIFDALALAQSPIDDKDLQVHILNNWGMSSTLSVRETPLSFSKLFDMLVDCEQQLHDKARTSDPVIATAHYTQRQSGNQFRSSTRSNQNGQSRNTRGTWSNHNNNHHNGGNRSSRTTTYCHFCNIPGHDTRDCRKLARFLKENNITIDQPPVMSAPQTAPVVNATSSQPT